MLMMPQLSQKSWIDAAIYNDIHQEMQWIIKNIYYKCTLPATTRIMFPDTSVMVIFFLFCMWNSYQSSFTFFSYTLHNINNRWTQQSYWVTQSLPSNDKDGHTHDSREGSMTYVNVKGSGATIHTNQIFRHLKVNGGIQRQPGWCLHNITFFFFKIRKTDQKSGTCCKEYVLKWFKVHKYNLFINFWILNFTSDSFMSLGTMLHMWWNKKYIQFHIIPFFLLTVSFSIIFTAPCIWSPSNVINELSVWKVNAFLF
jgi:hypothetical protein